MEKATRRFEQPSRNLPILQVGTSTSAILATNQDISSRIRSLHLSRNDRYPPRTPNSSPCSTPSSVDLRRNSSGLGDSNFRTARFGVHKGVAKLAQIPSAKYNMVVNRYDGPAGQLNDGNTEKIRQHPSWPILDPAYEPPTHQAPLRAMSGLNQRTFGDAVGRERLEPTEHTVEMSSPEHAKGHHNELRKPHYILRTLTPGSSHPAGYKLEANVQGSPNSGGLGPDVLVGIGQKESGLSPESQRWAQDGLSTEEYLRHDVAISSVRTAAETLKAQEVESVWTADTSGHIRSHGPVLPKKTSRSTMTSNASYKRGRHPLLRGSGDQLAAGHALEPSIAPDYERDFVYSEDKSNPKQQLAHIRGPGSEVPVDNNGFDTPDNRIKSQDQRRDWCLNLSNDRAAAQLANVLPFSQDVLDHFSASQKIIEAPVNINDDSGKKRGKPPSVVSRTSSLQHGIENVSGRVSVTSYKTPHSKQTKEADPNITSTFNSDIKASPEAVANIVKSRRISIVSEVSSPPSKQMPLIRTEETTTQSPSRHHILENGVIPRQKTRSLSSASDSKSSEDGTDFAQLIRPPSLSQQGKSRLTDSVEIAIRAKSPEIRRRWVEQLIGKRSVTSLRNEVNLTARLQHRHKYGTGKLKSPSRSNSLQNHQRIDAAGNGNELLGPSMDNSEAGVTMRIQRANTESFNKIIFELENLLNEAVTIAQQAAERELGTDGKADYFGVAKGGDKSAGPYHNVPSPWVDIKDLAVVRHDSSHIIKNPGRMGEKFQKHTDLLKQELSDILSSDEWQSLRGGDTKASKSSVLGPDPKQRKHSLNTGFATPICTEDNELQGKLAKAMKAGDFDELSDHELRHWTHDSVQARHPNHQKKYLANPVTNHWALSTPFRRLSDSVGDILLRKPISSKQLNKEQQIHLLREYVTPAEVPRKRELHASYLPQVQTRTSSLRLRSHPSTPERVYNLNMEPIYSSDEYSGADAYLADFPYDRASVVPGRRLVDASNAYSGLRPDVFPLQDMPAELHRNTSADNVTNQNRDIGLDNNGYSLRGRHHFSLRGRQGFSLSRSHRRAPIARDWSKQRKRLVAVVTCISTALMGLIIGIYAGEVPAIQYAIADENHYSILGNVVFFIGLAIPTALFYPLPLLHGRKPYTLGALVILLPLQFPQAVVVGEFRSPDQPWYRTGLLLSRALAGLAMGFANINFLTTLLDLFGSSLQSRNPHQEATDSNDVRRHGGGMGVWLGIWVWCSIGSIGVGFLIGAAIISSLDVVWGFWLTIILTAAVLLLNVFTPEVRRSAYRRSMAEVYNGTGVSRRIARGEVKMHLYSTGPKHWWEEVLAGHVLFFRMLKQPGFLVLSLYLGWIYGQVIMIILLLGALTSRYYYFRPQYVGLCVAIIPLGALLAVPFQKASMFSRSRSHAPRTDSNTFEKRVAWTSHLVRRTVFMLALPFAGMAYAIASGGTRTNVMVPTIFAGLIGFLSNLAIGECNGIIMENFDTSDLQPGMTGRPRRVLPEDVKAKRTNFSCFPRVTAAFAVTQTFAFLIAAAATGTGGSIERRLGAQLATGVVASVLLILTIMLTAVLTRFKVVQIVPTQRFGTNVLGGPEADWKPVIIGHPSGTTRRMSLLEMGAMTRWTEIRRRNKLMQG